MNDLYAALLAIMLYLEGSAQIMLIGDHSKYKPYIVNICGLLALAGKREALVYMSDLPLKSMRTWWHVVRLGILRWIEAKNG